MLLNFLVLAVFLTACQSTDNDSGAIDVNDEYEDEQNNINEVVIDYDMLIKETTEVIDEGLANIENIKVNEIKVYKDNNIVKTGEPERDYSNVVINVEVDLLNKENYEKRIDEVFSTTRKSIIDTLDLPNEYKSKLNELRIHYLIDGEKIDAGYGDYMGLGGPEHHEEIKETVSEKESLKLIFDYVNKIDNPGEVNMYRFGPNDNGGLYIELTSVESRLGIGDEETRASIEKIMKN